jgi:preprotein translocase subunit SecD
MHMETNPDPMGGAAVAPVFREKPVRITVEKEPFISEKHVAAAEVITNQFGYSIRIQFEAFGKRLLQQYSTAHRGRRCAIFCAFGEKETKARWLAAPVMLRTLSDGCITFTPDASLEECQELARCLNAVAKKADNAPAKSDNSDSDPEMKGYLSH